MKMKKIILIASLSLLSACGQNFSNGSYIGVVTKLSEKGLIFKSWEGEVSMGNSEVQK
jgi:major membrane immunogen (membrane-anchored lipoprotein)